MRIIDHVVSDRQNEALKTLCNLEKFKQDCRAFPVKSSDFDFLGIDVPADMFPSVDTDPVVESMFKSMLLQVKKSHDAKKKAVEDV